MYFCYSPCCTYLVPRLLVPYKTKGKCVYKKDTGKKVGCTDGPIDKYLAALHANANENIEKEAQSMKMTKEEMLQIIKEEVENLQDSIMIEHQCASHIRENKTGKQGGVIGNTLYPNGQVTHYDVEFDDEIKLNLPISEVTVLQERYISQVPNMPMPVPMPKMSHHHGGREGKMSRRQLVNIIEQAHDLLEMIENGSDLKEWVQLKITKASDYINTVHNYHHGDEILHNMETDGGCGE